jgi:hypothetical protein
MPRRKARSRGLLIPGMLDCSTLEDVLNRVRELALTGYPAFRLIALFDGDLVECRSVGGQLHEGTIDRLAEPRFFTSSGLGDHLVEGPRRSLFQSFFDQERNWTAQQEAFHRHTWPERTDLSVCMSRADARTISYTTIDLLDSTAALEYRSGSPVEAAATVRCCLPLKRGVFA